MTINITKKLSGATIISITSISCTPSRKVTTFPPYKFKIFSIQRVDPLSLPEKLPNDQLNYILYELNHTFLCTNELSWTPAFDEGKFITLSDFYEIKGDSGQLSSILNSSHKIFRTSTTSTIIIAGASVLDDTIISPGFAQYGYSYRIKSSFKMACSVVDPDIKPNVILNLETLEIPWSENSNYTIEFGTGVVQHQYGENYTNPSFTMSMTTNPAATIVNYSYDNKKVSINYIRKIKKVDNNYYLYKSNGTLVKTFTNSIVSHNGNVLQFDTNRILEPLTTYYLLSDESPARDYDNIPVTRITNTNEVRYTTGTPPTISNYTDTNKKITLIYDRDIISSTGSYRLYKSGGTLIKVYSPGMVTISGTHVEIDTNRILEPLTTYYLLSDSNAVKDDDYFATPAITNNTTITHITGSPPEVLDFSHTNKEITLEYNRDVVGPTGNYYLYKSDGTLISSYSPGITIVDNRFVTLGTNRILEPLTTYYLLADTGGVKDDDYFYAPAIISDHDIRYTSGPPPSILTLFPGNFNASMEDGVIIENTHNRVYNSGTFKSKNTILILTWDKLINQIIGTNALDGTIRLYGKPTGSSSDYGLIRKWNVCWYETAGVSDYDFDFNSYQMVLDIKNTLSEDYDYKIVITEDLIKDDDYFKNEQLDSGILQFSTPDQYFPCLKSSMDLETTNETIGNRIRFSSGNLLSNSSFYIHPIFIRRAKSSMDVNSTISRAFISLTKKSGSVIQSTSSVYCRFERFISYSSNMYSEAFEGFPYYLYRKFNPRLTNDYGMVIDQVSNGQLVSFRLNPGNISQYSSIKTYKGDELLYTINNISGSGGTLTIDNQHLFYGILTNSTYFLIIADLYTGNSIQMITIGSTNYSNIASSGTYVFVSVGTQTKVYNISTGALVRTLPQYKFSQQSVNANYFVATDNLLAPGPGYPTSSGKSVFVYDLSTLQIVHTFQNPETYTSYGSNGISINGNYITVGAGHSYTTPTPQQGVLVTGKFYTYEIGSWQLISELQNPSSPYTTESGYVWTGWPVEAYAVGSTNNHVIIASRDPYDPNNWKIDIFKPTGEFVQTIDIYQINIGRNIVNTGGDLIIRSLANTKVPAGGVYEQTPQNDFVEIYKL